MSGKIFINYRRGDDAGFTQALFQRLEDSFSAGDLFMDVEGHIKPGDDFVEVLSRQVAQCDVLLAVVGPRWVELLLARGGDPEDFVAIEIKAAIDQKKRVIPVLVGGAAMPRADTLPEAIRALARRNAVGLRPERFKADCQGLIGALKDQLAAAEQEREARTAKEREAAEAEQRQREKEEAARIEAVERQARAQSAAGLSAAEIRKAEELANWDFVKDRNDIQSLRDHIARFPGGTTALYALTRIEDLVWKGLGPSPDAPALRAFLEEFPRGEHVREAQEELVAAEALAAKLRAIEQSRAKETEEWGAVAASTDKAAIEAFIAKWPEGAYAADARSRLDELERGGTSRRWALKAFAGGVAATAVAGGGGYLTFVPGQPGWRLLFDKSVHTFTGERGNMSALAASPRGGKAFSADYSGAIYVWDIANRVLATTLDSKLSVSALAVTPDGNHLIAASSNIEIWDIANGSIARTFANTASIYKLAFTPDGRYLLAGGPEGFANVWEFATGKDVVALSGHTGSVFAIQATPDSRIAVSGCSDGKMMVWEIPTGRLLRTIDVGRSVEGLAVTPDGKRVVSSDGQVRDLATGSYAFSLLESSWIIDLAFVENSYYVVGGTGHNTVEMWSAIDGRRLATLSGHTDHVYKIAVTPDNYAISASLDGTIKLWKLTFG